MAGEIIQLNTPGIVVAVLLCGRVTVLLVCIANEQNFAKQFVDFFLNAAYVRAFCFWMVKFLLILVNRPLRLLC